MKIKLEKHSDNLYRASFLEWEGVAPIGHGETKHEAVAHLVHLVACSSDRLSHLIHHIGLQKLEVVESEPKQPLYAKIHLSRDCEIELKLTGEVTQEAFNRLLEFLKVTGELWGLKNERANQPH